MSLLSRSLMAVPLLLLAGVLSLPVLGIAASWLQWSTGSASALQGMASTVLGDYAWTTLWLSLGVALGVTVVGTATAAAVTLRSDE